MRRRSVDELQRRMPWNRTAERRMDPLLTREWLLTNGLGGYASGTVAGVVTRRYHGILIAALPAPLGRMVMLNHLSEVLRLPGGHTVQLGGEERAARGIAVPGADYLAEFRLESGLPVWRYQVEGFLIEKRILLLHGQNTVQVHYCLVEGDGSLRLKVFPSIHFRPHEAAVDAPLRHPYVLT